LIGDKWLESKLYGVSVETVMNVKTVKMLSVQTVSPPALIGAAPFKNMQLDPQVTSPPFQTELTLSSQLQSWYLFLVAFLLIQCGGVTAYKAVKVANLKQGQTVVILGAGGGVGSFALQYAHALGYKTIAVDGGAAKEKSTKALGAEKYIDFTKEKDLVAAVKEATNGGAHAVIVFSPSPQAYAQAPFMLRKRGTMVAVGLPGGPSPISVEPGYLAFYGIVIRGSLVGNQSDVMEALEIAKQGKIEVPSSIKKLEDLQSVMEDMEAGKVVGRVVLTFD
jgi:alcohol dehydrogenase, propanol-preferring